MSGMYSEKIGYANRYVPHANRALRNFNMYLNVRQPPLRSKLPFNPFSFLFPRTAPSTPNPVSSPSGSRRRSPSPSRPSKRSSSVPIPPIPPTSNPRGELIFSSRVDRAFREGYDRHRATFERMKEERERMAYQATWLGWLHTKIMRLPVVVPGPAASGTATPVGTPALGRTGSLNAVAGRGRVSSSGGMGSAGSTPSTSRRPSPVPQKLSRKSTTTRMGTPPRQSPLQQHSSQEVRSQGGLGSAVPPYT